MYMEITSNIFLFYNFIVWLPCHLMNYPNYIKRLYELFKKRTKIYNFYLGFAFAWNGTARRKTASGESQWGECCNIYLHSENIKYAFLFECIANSK